jgi:hypothetical protein
MKRKLINLATACSLMLGLGYTNLLMAKEGLTWINITVKFNDTTLEDLASTYYADVKEADTIYNANKSIIGKSKKLHKNMVLKIPVTAKFKDQPEHLGWN